MAEDILDDMDDDFDDTMADILEEEPLEEMTDELDEDLGGDLDEEKSSKKSSKKSGKKSSKPGIVSKIKELVQKILGSVKALIIVALSLVVLIILILVVWFVFLSSDSGETTDDLHPIVTEASNEAGLLSDEPIFEDIIELEPFERIPLKTSSTMGLVSLNLSLELIDPEKKTQIYASEERIREIVEGQVGNMTWLELRNPEGKILLKYKLLKRINSIFPKPVVRNVYFTFFIMQ